MPAVWASASDAVRTAGTARLKAAPSPRRQNAFRREMASDLICSLKMGLSEVTAKVHRSNAMHKLGVRSVPHLVRVVDAHGIPVIGRA